MSTRTTTAHTIVVESANLNGVVRLEAIADEALCPGELVRFDANEELELHATADGVLAGKMVVLESQTPDTITSPTCAAIDIEYDADDLAYYCQASPGDVLNMFLADSEVGVKGISQLVSNGDGSLKVETVDAATLADAIVGTAWQDVTASGATRCLVRIT